MEKMKEVSIETMSITLQMMTKKIDRLLKNEAPSDQYLTTNQLMEFLSCSRETVYRLKSNYDIPFYKIGGKLYTIKSEVESAIKNGRI